MNCPFCGYEESKVIDSRSTEEGEKIRRRRECLKCAGRFTTYESIESTPLMVIKKDQSRQPFQKEKLMRGLIHACVKRSVSTETLVILVNDIENYLRNNFIKEVNVEKIGELALDRLKDIDLVAYVRFASVYREFSTLEEFVEILKKLQSSNR